MKKLINLGKDHKFEKSSKNLKSSLNLEKFVKLNKGQEFVNIFANLIKKSIIPKEVHEF